MHALAKLLPLERAYEQSREDFEGIVEYADSEAAASMSHSELEKRGRELMRQVLQEHLDRRSPGEAKGPVKGRDSEERTQKRLQERALELPSACDADIDQSEDEEKDQRGADPQSHRGPVAVLGEWFLQ
jgi:hypothetical protein